MLIVRYINFRNNNNNNFRNKINPALGTLLLSSRCYNVLTSGNKISYRAHKFRPKELQDCGL